MKYDDASWQTQEIENKGKLWEIASAPIVLYLKWCWDKGWIGGKYQEDESCASDFEKLRLNELSLTDYFIRHCDCKLTDEELNGEGNDFTGWYYRKHYISDIARVVQLDQCQKSAEELGFEKVKDILDERFNEWKTRPITEANKNTWYQFW